MDKHLLFVEVFFPHVKSKMANEMITMNTYKTIVMLEPRIKSLYYSHNG